MELRRIARHLFVLCVFDVVSALVIAAYSWDGDPAFGHGSSQLPALLSWYKSYWSVGRLMIGIFGLDGALEMTTASDWRTFSHRISVWVLVSWNLFLSSAPLAIYLAYRLRRLSTE